MGQRDITQRPAFAASQILHKLGGPWSTKRGGSDASLDHRRITFHSESVGQTAFCTLRVCCVFSDLHCPMSQTPGFWDMGQSRRAEVIVVCLPVAILKRKPGSRKGKSTAPPSSGDTMRQDPWRHSDVLLTRTGLAMQSMPRALFPKKHETRECL